MVQGDPWGDVGQLVARPRNSEKEEGRRKHGDPEDVKADDVLTIVLSKHRHAIAFPNDAHVQC